jgi:hypothetical protein
MVRELGRGTDNLQKEIEMAPNLAFYRVAALTGAAAFLLSFAHVTPAVAQTSTRYAATCIAGPYEGEGAGECTVNVPAGKVFIIESATFGGLVRSEQFLQVRVSTKRGNSTFYHTVPAGFLVRDAAIQTWWNGALPGTIFAEAGPIKLQVVRAPGTGGEAWIRMTLTGRLEDL